MKEIKLTQGQVALVDDDDYEYLNQFKWNAHKDRNTFYAHRSSKKINGKRKTIQMHCEIMKPPIGKQVDHQDHDGLNCQKYNMRNCTPQQNTLNRSPMGKSKYLGVCFIKSFNKHNKNIRYRDTIIAQVKHIYLGAFKTEEDAARAYDKKALELFGEFANLNFK